MATYVLKHHGIKGMKWGVRRYQNKDGTLTAAGKKRYSKLNIRDVDAQLQKNYGTAELAAGGVAAAYGSTLLAIPALAVGALPVAIGMMGVGSFAGTGMLLGSVAKYYKDGHDYVHKYDDKNSAGRVSKKRRNI